MILSLDPGIRETGWAVLDGTELVAFGILRPEDFEAGVPARIDSLCVGLEALLAEYRPEVILLEWNSGKVNQRRHKGGGAGLATHGAVCAALWRDARHWARRRGDVRVVPVTESQWTRGIPKETRALAVANEFPDYRPCSDPGLNIADSIGLALYWIREDRVRSIA